MITLTESNRPNGLIDLLIYPCGEYVAIQAASSAGRVFLYGFRSNIASDVKDRLLLDEESCDTAFTSIDALGLRTLTT